MRISIKKMLEPYGYTVYESENGEDCIEKYGRLLPDLVLMDITMPYMSGLDSLKAIRAKYPKAKVIMCTAMGQQDKVCEAIMSGAESFIVKPIDEQRLVEAVAKSIGMPE
jgi:two-component system chemotaxis response regulator CheY